MTRYLIVLIVSLISLTIGSAQNARLAQQYFQNGEYEKAAELYADLYQSNGIMIFSLIGILIVYWL